MNESKVGTTWNMAQALTAFSYFHPRVVSICTKDDQRAQAQCMDGTAANGFPHKPKNSYKTSNTIAFKPLVIHRAWISRVLSQTFYKVSAKNVNELLKFWFLDLRSTVLAGMLGSCRTQPKPTRFSKINILIWLKMWRRVAQFSNVVVNRFKRIKVQHVECNFVWKSRCFNVYHAQHATNDDL